MEQTRLTDFGRIDQTADPAPFIDFLDAACATASFRVYKRQLAEALGLPGDLAILDVGCGTGDDVRDMARLVSGRGRVVGLDNSQVMIAEARKRAEGSELPVEFQAGDALALPFDTDTFDACQADRSLMHVPDPRRALAEMLRVTRPGGRLGVFEVDFGTVALDTDQRPLFRRVLSVWCGNLRDDWLGRRIPALLREVGVQDVRVVPQALLLTPPLALPVFGAATVEKAVKEGIVTREEGKTWLDHLDALQRSGSFFSAMIGYLVAGKK
jgi:ubiquinone/menaquinone biosynthesis C-methylase UbiE